MFVSLDKRTERIFDEALRNWGAEGQMRMVQEECAELIVAINKLDRGQGNKDQVCEELADVLIMVAQAQRILKMEDTVTMYLREKLDRTERVLDEHKRERQR